MAFFNSKIKRFLMAIAGKDTCPDPDSPYERCLADIAKRIDTIEQNQGQGGGGTFYITFNNGNEEIIEIDQTIDEIKEAYDAGKTLMMVDTSTSRYYHLSTYQYYDYPTGYLASLSFSNFFATSAAGGSFTYIWYDDMENKFHMDGKTILFND